MKYQKCFWNTRSFKKIQEIWIHNDWKLKLKLALNSSEINLPVDITQNSKTHSIGNWPRDHKNENCALRTIIAIIRYQMNTIKPQRTILWNDCKWVSLLHASTVGMWWNERLNGLLLGKDENWKAKQRPLGGKR